MATARRVALDTEWGVVVDSWTIPASDISVAPGGDYLVTPTAVFD